MTSRNNAQQSITERNQSHFLHPFLRQLCTNIRDSAQYNILKGKKTKSTTKIAELYHQARFDFDNGMEKFLLRLRSHPSEAKIRIDDNREESIHPERKYANRRHNSCRNFLEYGSTPLHIILSRHPQPPAHILEEYLSIDPQATRCKNFLSGRLPIHIATISPSTPENIQLLVDTFPESINVPDDSHGWNVFHNVAYFGKPDHPPNGVITALASISSISAPLVYEAVRAKDHDGNTPLHLSCACGIGMGMNLASFETLLFLAPDAALMENTRITQRIKRINYFIRQQHLKQSQGTVRHDLYLTKCRFIPPKERHGAGKIPLELLCEKYHYKLLGSIHLLKPMFHCWKKSERIMNNSTLWYAAKQGYSPSMTCTDIHYRKFLEQIFEDQEELLLFLRKAFLFVRTMHRLSTEKRPLQGEIMNGADMIKGMEREINSTQLRQAGQNNTIGNCKNDEFSTLHACLSLTSSWCPNVVTLFAILTQPDEVRTMSDDHGNFPLHIAANAVASVAAKRSRELTEENMFQWREDVTTSNIIDYLLDCYPEAASIPNGEGHLPLQLIVGNKCLGGHEDSGKEGRDNRQGLFVTSSASWNEGVGSILRAYPLALESLDLAGGLYPHILSRFTRIEPCGAGSRKEMSDFDLLFDTLKESNLLHQDI